MSWRAVEAARPEGVGAKCSQSRSSSSNESMAPSAHAPLRSAGGFRTTSLWAANSLRADSAPGDRPPPGLEKLAETRTTSTDNMATRRPGRRAMVLRFAVRSEFIWAPQPPRPRSIPSTEASRNNGGLPSPALGPMPPGKLLGTGNLGLASLDQGELRSGRALP